MRKLSGWLAVLCGSAAILAAVTNGADCDGDECQVPPAPPAEVIPATSVVNGPPNPPVHFPKRHKAKGKNGKRK